MRRISDISEFSTICNNLEGIIIGIPNDSFSYRAELYIIKQNNKGALIVSAYNSEDETIHGFTQDSKPTTFANLVSDFEMLTYYHFEDLKEFCRWYLQQQGDEIWTTSGGLKGKLADLNDEIQWINEGISVELNTKEEVKPTRKRRDVLKDVIEYLRRLDIIRDCESSIRNYSSPCLCNDIFHQELAKYKDNLEKWLDEEIE